MTYQNADLFFVPDEVQAALTVGVSPLRAWRTHKALSTMTMAFKLEMSEVEYMQLERKGAAVSTHHLRRAAQAFQTAAANLL